MPAGIGADGSSVDLAAAVSEVLMAFRPPLTSRHIHGHATAFGVDGTIKKTTGGMCAPEGEMRWGKTPDGKQSKYWLCYAPAFRNGGQGPTGGSLQCDAHSYLSIEAPKFCCRNPRIMINGEKFHAKAEVCGDVLADFDPGSQKVRFTRAPRSDGTKAMMLALQSAGMGSRLPSPIAYQANNGGSEWKLLLGQRCVGREGTLIQWPTGRVELCPTGSQPVHGAGYSSWQCDGTFKKERRLHCCSVKGKMKCVPNLVDQSGAMKCNCKGVGGNEWSEDAELKEGQWNDPGNAPNSACGLPPLAVLFLTSLGSKLHSRSLARKGYGQHLGQDFL